VVPAFAGWILKERSFHRHVRLKDAELKRVSTEAERIPPPGGQHFTDPALETRCLPNARSFPRT
jgi:hypothetical protein